MAALSRQECFALLATVPVGRMGVSIGALPAVLPVNFLLHAGGIIIRTVPGSKLDAATAHRVVAFEADAWAADGSWGWSVLVQGPAEEVTEEDQVEELRALPLGSWAFPGEEAARFLRIETVVISGRRFGAEAVPAAG